jgi:hypothetical protein
MQCLTSIKYCVRFFVKINILIEPEMGKCAKKIADLIALLT